MAVIHNVTTVLDEDEKQQVNGNIDTIEVASLRDSQFNGASASIAAELGQRGGKAPILITESGLYRLMLRSNAENAEKVQVWVEDEVLPTIRKTATTLDEDEKMQISPTVINSDGSARGANPWPTSLLVMLLLAVETRGSGAPRHVNYARPSGADHVMDIFQSPLARHEP